MIAWIQCTGWLLARLPEKLLYLIVFCLGHGLYILLPSRRRNVLRNLHHAFPQKPLPVLKSIARTTFCRGIELGLHALILPHFSPARICRSFAMSPQLKDIFEQRREDPHPSIILSPHTSQMEVLSYSPWLYTPLEGKISTLFRPLDNPTLNNWIIRTRGRAGVQGLSRRQGLLKAKELLKSDNVLCILFDQNAGHVGSLSLFFQRVASTTTLANSIATPETVAYYVYVERTRFLRGQLKGQRIEASAQEPQSILQAQQILEKQLQSSDDHCADWLWLHKRWKTQDDPRQRFRLEAKRQELLPPGPLPRHTRLYIRLSNWLGDIVMFLPLLRALRQSRPDMHITLLASAPFAPWLDSLGLAEAIIPLPPKGFSRFAFFYRLRTQFPDTYLLMTNSSRGDMEAWLTGAPQRFGLRFPQKKRPLLTHHYPVPAQYQEAAHHQSALWQDYLAHFGLQQPVDTSPFYPTKSAALSHIGLICGSENSPEKRWPIHHWRSLIHALTQQGIRITLFGTPNDQAITQHIAKGFSSPQVKDRAGQTDLLHFTQELRHCQHIIGNDTGGIHLANALGIPSTVLYGPTNPIRTRPIFDSPCTLLQPTGCPPQGGHPIDQITPQQVLDSLAISSK